MQENANLLKQELENQKNILQVQDQKISDQRVNFDATMRSLAKVDHAGNQNLKAEDNEEDDLERDEELDAVCLSISKDGKLDKPFMIQTKPRRQSSMLT